MDMQPVVDRPTPSKGELDRSLVLAEAAQSKIRTLRLLPIPRNYEICYAYGTRTNRALNKAFDDLLADRVSPSESDLERLYETHFPAVRAIEQVDKLGACISAELNGVVKLITATLGSASIYDERLDEASRDLAATGDLGSVRSAVQSLVAATLEMQKDGRQLKTRLDGAVQEIANLQQGLESIRMESRTDPLTELGNRKYFDEAISEAVRTSGPRGDPLSLLMIDIDHFKSFNDTYGHMTGDQVLRLVAMSLKQNIKGQDLATRYGGEEFAIILPNTSMKQAVAVAEHVRRAVMAKELKKRSTGEIIGRITISVGVASLSELDTSESFIERADNCLYAAKHGGRNRVIGTVDSEAPPKVRTRVA